MDFSTVIFNTDGDFYTPKRIVYKSPNIIEIEFHNRMEFNNIVYHRRGLIGYFTVKENNGDISGIRRFLKIESIMTGKNTISVDFVDFVPDEVRELYGTYIEHISEYYGLRRLIHSFNDLIYSGQTNNSFDTWLSNILFSLSNIKLKGVIEKYITRFSNLYLIKVYEKLYSRNIELLISQESEITFKILETKRLIGNKVFP